jgi:hypothetical protein
LLALCTDSNTKCRNTATYSKEDVEYSTCTHYFGQVVMGLMAGFWGVLLATPVVVIIMILVNKLYIETGFSDKIIENGCKCIFLQFYF